MGGLRSGLDTSVVIWWCGVQHIMQHFAFKEVAKHFREIVIAVFYSVYIFVGFFFLEREFTSRLNGVPRVSPISKFLQF